MKVRVSSIFCAVGAFLLACLAVAVSSTSAAEPSFHHGEWPFNSPVRPAAPNIANPAWAANPIDRFRGCRFGKGGAASAARSRQGHAAPARDVRLDRLAADDRGAGRISRR